MRHIFHRGKINDAGRAMSQPSFLVWILYFRIWDIITLCSVCPSLGGQNRRSADSYYYSSDITVLPVTAYPVEKLENLMRQNFSQTAFLPNL